MTNIDQFESVFKAAAKTPFQYQPVALRSVMVVTDLTEDAGQFAGEVVQFLRGIEPPGGWQLTVLQGHDFDSIGRLLEIVERDSPDVIVTYRNLHSSSWQWPYSLGDYLDVLTQVARPPVLLLPNPHEANLAGQLDQGTGRVMAITDHLVGDDRLVSFALAMTSRGGTLLLSHVEDRAALERFLDAVSKIPGLDTDMAREQVPNILLKEARQFIESCRKQIRDRGVDLQIEELASLGHSLVDHVRIVSDHRINLLVLNTKDDDQAAMHGLAYPLSVELRKTPLLLL